MKHSYFIFLCAFLLTACAFDTLDKGLPLLNDKHIDVAINYLGMPDSEQMIANRKVYIWGHQNSGTYVRPITQQTTTTAYGYGGPYTAYGTTTTYVNESYNYSCKIKIIADKKNIIKSSEYEGDLGGCEHFSSGIDRLIEDSEAKATP